MGTLNAIYVRIKEPSHSAALRSLYPTAATEDGLEFYVAEQAKLRFTPPEEELAALSARFKTDVIWLGFQSVVDAFQFHHWQAGVTVRALVYGCVEQGEWERVYGKPEPWEQGAFFATEDLTRRLQDADGKEAVELRRIWRDAKLAPDRREPIIEARESARAVAEYYRLPGWS
jgi:hypothetical protein